MKEVKKMSNRKKYDRLARQRKEAMDAFTASWVTSGYRRKSDMDKFTASFAGESERSGEGWEILSGSGKKISKKKSKKKSRKKRSKPIRKTKR